MLAKIGMNESGLAIGLNIVRSVRDGLHPGVPVHALLRHLLSCESMQQARRRLDELRALGFGSSSNIPCADRLGAVGCFEIAPSGWAELEPTAGVVVHTNHFLCSALVPDQAPLGAVVSSDLRLISAARHARARPLGLAELQAFLRDESDGPLSICRSPDPRWPPEARMESVAGIIMRAQTGEIWIAPNVPSQVAFTAVS